MRPDVVPYRYNSNHQTWQIVFYISDSKYPYSMFWKEKDTNCYVANLLQTTRIKLVNKLKKYGARIHNTMEYRRVFFLNEEDAQKAYDEYILPLCTMINLTSTF